MDSSLRTKRQMETADMHLRPWVEATHVSTNNWAAKTKNVLWTLTTRYAWPQWSSDIPSVILLQELIGRKPDFLLFLVMDGFFRQTV